MTFLTFLKGLIDKLGSSRAYLVMDNLPIHHSKKVREMVDLSPHEIVWLPPYTCSLNPIEKVWYLIKNEWRKKLIEKGNHKLQHELVKEEIDKIIQTLGNEKIA